MACQYNGVEYSEGSLICANGRELRCAGGEWQETGYTCSTISRKFGALNTQDGIEVAHYVKDLCPAIEYIVYAQPIRSGEGGGTIYGYTNRNAQSLTILLEQRSLKSDAVYWSYQTIPAHHTIEFGNDSAQVIGGPPGKAGPLWVFRVGGFRRATEEWDLPSKQASYAANNAKSVLMFIVNDSHLFLLNRSITNDLEFTYTAEGINQAAPLPIIAGASWRFDRGEKLDTMRVVANFNAPAIETLDKR